MSRAKLPFDLPIDHVHIVRWDDPVLDAIGHDPRSPYVERYWLSLLGPAKGAGQNARTATARPNRLLTEGEPSLLFESRLVSAG